tara:strand:+ start:212 stop:448 length:237 start_codon:yes stop_codon:yes gene_type:complete
MYGLKIQMIKLKIEPNGNQTLTKVCNDCGCYLDDLTTDDILVKKAELSELTITDSQGNEVTRTELPDELCNCKCEHCE